jgi:hypothetical protein
MERANPDLLLAMLSLLCQRLRWTTSNRATVENLTKVVERRCGMMEIRRWLGQKLAPHRRNLTFRSRGVSRSGILVMPHPTQEDAEEAGRDPAYLGRCAGGFGRIAA